MTIRTALRKLYTAMCGGTTNESTAGDLINAIATDYTGGGGSLPAAGADGNVLTADDGEWVSAAPASDDFVVTADLTIGATFEVSNPSKTVAECLAAKNAGKNVRMLCINETYGVVLDARMMVASEVALFAATSYINSHWYSFNIMYGGSLTITSCVLLDAPTSNDNGKILGVADGAYALVAPTLVVHGTISGTTATITDQITIADIAEQAADGRTVYFDVTGANGEIERHTLCGYVTNASGIAVSFMALTLKDDEQQVTRLAATYIILQHSETLGDTSLVYQKIIENV